MSQLFVNYYKIDTKIHLPIESLITIFVYNKCSPNIQLRLVQIKNDPTGQNKHNLAQNEPNLGKNVPNKSKNDLNWIENVPKSAKNELKWAKNQPEGPKNRPGNKNDINRNIFWPHFAQNEQNRTQYGAKNNTIFELDIEIIPNFELVEVLPDLANFCELPLVILENTTVISGLCSVARQIVKCSPHDIIQELLGFREACLMAPNECSIWTKFCEIDMISSLKNIFNFPENYFGDEILIPKDLTRFEIHMNQPVRLHNIYKVAQNNAKQKKGEKNNITTEIKKENLNLPHEFSEGPFMTLADLILYPQILIFKQIFQNIDENIFEKYLPLTNTWVNKMADNKIKIADNLKITNKNLIMANNDFEIPEIDFKISEKYFEISDNANTLKIYFKNIFKNFKTKNPKKIIEQNIEKTSLYVSDPKRYKPQNRIFTKQIDIDNALCKIDNLTSKITIEQPYGFEIDFNWDLIPNEANPLGGALPEKRMLRKRDQLENLAKAVIKIAKNGNVIVDFCSGSGHLGILLAVKLPNCQIILLENKERSLLRAKERVTKLKLSNVIFLQCNLDYFNANFDIGVSLHACGVATDLVLQHCLSKRANFVCTPCCYGKVHETHHISYPRSKIFKYYLTLRDYLVLGHSADQTHDFENLKTKQGIECMNIIDYDRILWAKEFCYDVFLAKMIPQNCTPKNNILVGIYNPTIN